MIPSIQEILRSVMTGAMGLHEAVKYMEQHLALAAEVADDDLRDLFAGQAMQAVATYAKGADGFTFGDRATWAYQQADAMMKARKE